VTFSACLDPGSVLVDGVEAFLINIDTISISWRYTANGSSALAPSLSRSLGNTLRKLIVHLFLGRIIEGFAIFHDNPFKMWLEGCPEFQVLESVGTLSPIILNLACN
jgi:hypothetical protein